VRADRAADWWGLELVLPPPSLAFLAHAPSVAHAIINFLTALSVANNGVAELLPFVRYISQYVDFEWGTIQKADQGKGVVCAATWIMPAAMVPRPWDFPDPPAAADAVDPPTGAAPVDTAALAKPPADATGSPPASSTGAPALPDVAPTSEAAPTPVVDAQTEAAATS
jgi:hypothetical protein